MEKLFIPKFCDANSILLINKVGVIRKLYCPFRIKFIGEVRDFQLGVHLWVEEVATNKKGDLIYLIFNKPYSYKHFEIIATF